MARLKDRLPASLLRALVARRRLDCVIDVGANRAQYCLLLRYRVGLAGPPISFVPISERAADLADRARSTRKIA